MGEGKAVVVMESEKGCRGKCRRTNDAAPTFYWVFLIPAPNFSVEPEPQPDPVRHQEDVSREPVGSVQADPRRPLLQRHASPDEVTDLIVAAMYTFWLRRPSNNLQKWLLLELKAGAIVLDFVRDKYSCVEIYFASNFPIKLYSIASSWSPVYSLTDWSHS